MLTNTTLNIGNAGYVSINGGNYVRGYLLSQYNITDDTLCILYANTRTRLTEPMLFSGVLDGDNSNAPFDSLDAVKAWMDANFEGANGLFVGNSVGGGLAGAVIFIDPDGNLAVSNNLTYSDESGRMTIGGNEAATNANIGDYAVTPSNIVNYSNLIDFLQLLNFPPWINNFDGSYGALTGIPSFGNVAFSNDYNSLDNLPILPVFVTSSFTVTGIVLQTVFTFAHGLGYTPSNIWFTPISAGAMGVHYYSWDGTNITITFAAAPGVVPVTFKYTSIR